KSVCNDCGLCIERCQFGAWEFDEDDVVFNIDHCFGCGLCVSSCPAGAVSLVKR
ncbi:MAG: 4Fe-4S binding protein, partial [Theionarchaea archaeon]|nr:4Fe-4S binding protein [Theionarchaea archaeon]